MDQIYKGRVERICQIIRLSNDMNQRTKHLMGLPVVGAGLSIQKQIGTGGVSLGWGLRAVRDLPKGTLIQYEGDIITKKEALTRHETQHFKSWNGLVVAGIRDPEQAFGLGGASFANHCVDRSRRNTTWYSAWNGIFIKTTRVIKANQFIWTNYGSNFLRSNLCEFEPK